MAEEKKENIKKEDTKPQKRKGALSIFWQNIKLSFYSFGGGEEKDYFIENLSMLIDAGVGIATALDSIKQEIRSRSIRYTMDFLKEEVESGSQLWRALERAKILPESMVYLVRTGEESGKLPQNLRVIVRQQQKERAFRSKIKSAMIYPIIVISLTFVVATGVTWFILPRLALSFSKMRIKLPGITVAMIKVGEFMDKYGSVAVPVFLVGVFIFIFFVFIYKRTRFIGQTVLFKLPGVKQLMQEVELARMGFVMGNLLEAGLPIINTINSLMESSSFYVYTSFYSYLRDRLDVGDSFQKIFKSYKNVHAIIPAPIQQLIIAGEQSGQLPDVFKKIGEAFEEKSEVSTKNLSVIIEPIFLIIIAIGVLVVALAIILPIYSLIGSVGR
jgi:type II secretory pathway component PulF